MRDFLDEYGVVIFIGLSILAVVLVFGFWKGWKGVLWGLIIFAIMVIGRFWYVVWKNDHDNRDGW